MFRYTQEQKEMNFWKDDPVYDAFSIFLSHKIHLEEIMPGHLSNHAAWLDIWKKCVALDFS